MRSEVAKMTAMINGNPTEIELRERIERQLGWRGATEIVGGRWGIGISRIKRVVFRNR